MCQVVEMLRGLDGVMLTFAEMVSNDGNEVGFTRVPCDRFHVESASPKHASRSLK